MAAKNEIDRPVADRLWAKTSADKMLCQSFVEATGGWPVVSWHFTEATPWTIIGRLPGGKAVSFYPARVKLVDHSKYRSHDFADWADPGILETLREIASEQLPAA